jgi:hypothetical protein
MLHLAYRILDDTCGAWQSWYECVGPALHTSFLINNGSPFLFSIVVAVGFFFLTLYIIQCQEKITQKVHNFSPHFKI